MTNYKDYNKIKIIGITGSCGKTTTIKIVHEYLKAIGKKSVLFASCGIDLPTKNYNPSDEIEIPIYNEKSLKSALKGALLCESEYLLLEINERTIEKGYVKDVPFYIRALTNIIPYHNTFDYTKDEYIKIKESFFKDIPDEQECTCIYGEVHKDYFNDLMSANNKTKKIVTSRYIAGVRGIKEDDVDYLFYPNNEFFDSLDGLQFNVKTRDDEYLIKTNLLMPHNALNINMALAIIDTLGELDIEAFNQLLNSIIIPGRDEVLREKGRIVLTSITCAPHLEALKRYKEKGLLNNIILVTGSYGSGFSTWEEKYNTDKYIKYVNDSMKFIYKYIIRNVDTVYITSVDNANSDPLELINNQIKEVKGILEYHDFVDRKEAITKAIENSCKGDVIFISGRGNRAIFCKTKNEIDYFKDIDIAKEALNGLKE